MYMIQQSFVNELKKNNKLSLFIYSDSSIKTDQTFNCKPKTDLADTDTSFIVQYEYGNVFLDFKKEQEDYLKYRYIQYTKSTGEIVNIRIDGYDNETGNIVISEPFGEAVTTDDTFSIIVLDSLYCYANSPQTMTGGQTRFSKEQVRIDMKLQTKNDPTRQKLLGFVDGVKQVINSSSALPIYETEDFINIEGHAKPTRNVRFNETLNSGDQYLEYFGTSNWEYYYGY